jgi:hypothetical protein
MDMAERQRELDRQREQRRPGTKSHTRARPTHLLTHEPTSYATSRKTFGRPILDPVPR